MKWKLGFYRGYLCSILFGDTMVPNIEYDYILLFGIVLYIRNIILLGSTTKKSITHIENRATTWRVRGTE